VIAMLSSMKRSEAYARLLALVTSQGIGVVVINAGIVSRHCTETGRVHPNQAA